MKATKYLTNQSLVYKAPPYATSDVLRRLDPTDHDGWAFERLFWYYGSTPLRAEYGVRIFRYRRDNWAFELTPGGETIPPWSTVSGGYPVYAIYALDLPDPHTEKITVSANLIFNNTVNFEKGDEFLIYPFVRFVDIYGVVKQQWASFSGYRGWFGTSGLNARQMKPCTMPVSYTIQGGWNPNWYVWADLFIGDEESWFGTTKIELIYKALRHQAAIKEVEARHE